MYLTVTPLARADVKENAVNLESQRKGLGDRFIQAVEDTYEALRNHPEIAGRLETRKNGLLDVRAWPIKGFRNHIAYYRITGDRLLILRKLHGSRDIESHLG